MLFGQESKQLWRTPIRMLAICLALAMITGMLAIAHGLKLAADRMWAQVETEYTTIGYIPTKPRKYMNIAEAMKKNYLSSNNALIKAINGGGFASEVALHIDRHSRMMAYDSDLKGAVSDIADLNKPHNLAVFAVRCGEILVSRVEKYMLSGGQSPIPTSYSINVYYYNFEV